MRPNSYGVRVPVSRRGTVSRSGRALDLSDSTVRAFYGGLQREWTEAEGCRVEGRVREALRGFTPIGWARPENLADASQALLNGTSSRRGQLSYKPAAIEETANAVRQLLPSIERLDHPAATALISKLQAVEDACRAFRSLRTAPSNHPVTQWSLDYYGKPSRGTLEVAQSILFQEEIPSAPPRHLGSTDVVGLFEAYLASLPGKWSVTVEPIQAAMLVRSMNHQIVVRENLLTTEGEALRLLAHEIGGHIVRTLNAQCKEGSLASVSLGPDSTSTEEGLAVWWEHALGVEQLSVMRIYAARAIAVDMALEAGASDIIKAIGPAIGHEEATVIALRVKRGMHDLEAPGAFTKDHSYLSGYLEITQTVSGPQQEEIIQTLMATKWGLSMLPVARELIASGVLPTGRMPWEVCSALTRRT